MIGGGKMRMMPRKRTCRFCVDPNLTIDYKEPKLLGSFVSERGRIVPRRISGNCAYHQKKIAKLIKRARVMALLPFTATQQ